MLEKFDFTIFFVYYNNVNFENVKKTLQDSVFSKKIIKLLDMGATKI